jgi:DNA-binding transcriptional MerR regulator
MYVTTAELARSLNVSTTHIAYWWHTGRIPEPKRIGCSRVYTEAQAVKVRDWYARHREQRAAQTR